MMQSENMEIPLAIMPMMLLKGFSDGRTYRKQLGSPVHARAGQDREGERSDSELPQSSIVRLENGTYSPSLGTISKVLTAIVKRIYIGDLT